MLKKTIKLSGVLFLIAFGTALLLGLTNELTKDTIAARQQEAKNAAMAEVLPADSYILGISKEKFELCTAVKDKAAAGYTVSISEAGYGGDIFMTVGISTDFIVTGVVITEMSETPSLGDNAKNPEFRDTFKDLGKNDLFLTSEGGKIHALSGATVTSEAVTKGVRRAVEIATEFAKGGNY